MSEPTTLVAPDGQRFDVPTTEGAAKLRAKGFRDLTDNERKDVELQKKFGEGVLPAIGAAASGAASGLTFGLSDLALAQTPLAEANREIAERNPTAHTVGQVAAVAVPIASGLSAASAAARAAKATTLEGALIAGRVPTATRAADIAASGMTAVGKGAAALGSAVAETGLGKIVGGAVQGAAEGVAFQVGSNVGTAARRDAKLDAETLLAHVGEAAIFGGGVGAAIPAAGKVARWSADKAVAGLEKGMQGLRELGFGAAQAGVDAVEAGAGALARNADDIGAAVAGAGQKAAGFAEKAAGAVVGKADDIGAVAEKGAKLVTDKFDDVLLPKIREGLTKQTERPDIIDDVFATGEKGQALRQELGAQTLTGTREVHAEKLAEAGNAIWKQSIENGPLFDDIALAAKKDAQAAELAGHVMTRETQLSVAKNIATEAGNTFEQLNKFSGPNGAATKFFKDAIDDFVGNAMTKPSPDAIYMGLDRLKQATDKIAKWSQGAALGDSGAAFAAEEARKFRTFAKKMLEDETVWGAAGAVQHEVNAAYSRYRHAFDAFKAQFGMKGPKNVTFEVLDGGKFEKWAREIAGQKGDIRNTVVDELVEAQSELISITDRLAKRVNNEARAATSLPARMGEAGKAGTSIPEATIAEVLKKSRGQADSLAAAKDAAAKAVDRAEVLQQTQNAILSRQGAGVNPLPVQLAQKLGSGVLVGGAVGGVPGAIAGGALSSVLEKYGAITTNPKSAIEFLNTIDKLRGANKEAVSSWIKKTLGETSTEGARGALTKAAEKLDGKTTAEAIRKGAGFVEAQAPKVRGALERGNAATAKKIVEAKEAASRGIESIATRASAGSQGMMQRLLPAVSYADVTTAPPDTWWKNTKTQLVQAQADPQRAIERMQKDVAGIAEAFPDVAEAVTGHQMRVLGYLAERMPRNPRPFVLGDKEWTPDAGELKQFRDLVLVATKPDALLPLVTLGTATRAQVDAVRELWPKKFESTRTTIVQAVEDAAADGKPVSYEARVKLGDLLGVPLDASQLPGFGGWLQAPPPEPAQQQQAPGATVRGNFKLDSKTMMPGSMRASERK